MKRVGRGPVETIEQEKPRVWIPSPAGGGRWEEARPAKRIQRCTESQYALRGLRYYRACGKACREVDKRLSLGETLSDSGGM